MIGPYDLVRVKMQNINIEFKSWIEYGTDRSMSIFVFHLKLRSLEKKGAMPLMLTQSVGLSLHH